MSFRKILKHLIRIVDGTCLVAVLSALCAFKTKRASSFLIKHDAVQVLALSPNRFIADLRELEKTGVFEVHQFPEYWQYFGLALYGSEDRRRNVFMTRFLKAYQRHLPFDVVIGAAVWYGQDIPWGAVAQKAGIPYVVLHKESFKPEPLQARAAAERALKFGSFMGERLLVHNKPMAEAFVDNKYISGKQVNVCGAMRMDKFLLQVKNMGGVNAATRERPLVTYFSFTLGLGLDDRGVDPFPETPQAGWYELFRESHLAFSKLARMRPDIDFVIKTKWGGQWTGLIVSVLKSGGVDLDRVDNLTVQSSGKPHELILDSTVVCGFSSTTILEASVAGKPVIIPHFGEVEQDGFQGRIKLFDKYHLFDIGRSPAEFTSLIEERLAEPNIALSVQEERLELFERWVSPLDGSALSRYVEILRQIAQEGVVDY